MDPWLHTYSATAVTDYLNIRVVINFDGEQKSKSQMTIIVIRIHPIGVIYVCTKWQMLTTCKDTSVNYQTNVQSYAPTWLKTFQAVR